MAKKSTGRAKKSSKTPKKAFKHWTPRTQAQLLSILESVNETQLLQASGLNRGLLYLLKTGSANASEAAVGAIMGSISAHSAEALLTAFLHDVAERVATEDTGMHGFTGTVEVAYPPAH